MLSIKQSASRRARASSRLLVLVAAVMAMVAATMAPAAATPRVGGVTTAPQLKAQAADTSGAANYAVEVSNQVALAVLPPIDLYTTAGTVTIGGQTIPVWGYDTAPGPKNAAGGPTIEVTEGDIVTVTLHNNLNQPSALLFGGQSMIPDTEGAASGGVKTYVFTADKPGTYLYQAGLVPNHQHQVAMGLYGALIVKPAGAVSVTGTSTAADVTYADAVLADTPAELLSARRSSGTDGGRRDGDKSRHVRSDRSTRSSRVGVEQRRYRSWIRRSDRQRLRRHECDCLARSDLLG